MADFFTDYANSTLRYGDKGQKVTDFQDALRVALGGAAIAVDGIYGSVTEEHVQKAYQAFGLPGVSGTVTPALYAAVTKAGLTGKNIYEVAVKKPMVMDPLYIEGNSPKTSFAMKAAVALAVVGVLYVGLKSTGTIK